MSRSRCRRAASQLLRLGGSQIAEEAQAVQQISDEYRFFHWHIEFPQIFPVGEGAASGDGPGWVGGFTCVLGNPPWDQVQFDPREFFAASAPEIAAAPNAAARERLIDNLERDNSVLYARYSAGQRLSDGVKHFVHASGRFPLTAFGRLNTYSLFVEHFTWIVGPSGRAGAIVPTGIATDSFNLHFFGVSSSEHHWCRSTTSRTADRCLVACTGASSSAC